MTYYCDKCNGLGRRETWLWQDPDICKKCHGLGTIPAKLSEDEWI